MSDKVYYDGNCYVCSAEIGAVRKKGEACGIEFVDIAELEDPEYYMVEMIGQFDGEETVGTETFRKMYEKIGYKKIVYLTRLPIIKQFVDAGYHVFARWIRPFLPKRN